MFKSLFLLVFFAFNISATTFSPVSIKDQIQDSGGLVQGEVVAVTSEKDPEYGIVSKVFIRADRWIGADVSNNHVSIFYPGGVVGDEGVKVEGAPSFAPGEKVVVLTKNHQGKQWVQNLGMGKFSVKKAGRVKVVVNQIFPNLPEVGQMPLKSFLVLAQDLKETNFTERYKDKYERAAEKKMSALPSLKRTGAKKGRMIASVGEASPSNPADRPSPLWLVVLLGALGVGVRFAGGKNGHGR